MEIPEQPKLEGYTPVTYRLATRIKAKGRASGGLTVYRSDSSTVPVRALPREPEMDLEALPGSLVIEIGEPDEERGCLVIAAYYQPPGMEPDQIHRAFEALATLMQRLETLHHKVLLMGDSNGDRGPGGVPTARENNTAAYALQEAERTAGHTWLEPSKAGALVSRYAISAARMKAARDFDPADATSNVDHVSAGPKATRHATVKNYRLNEELHFQADHVGLLLECRIVTSGRGTLSMKEKPPRRKRIEVGSEKARQYERATEEPLTQWEVKYGDLKRKWDEGCPDTRKEMKATGDAPKKRLHRAMRELNTVLNAAAKVCGNTRPKRMMEKRKLPSETRGHRKRKKAGMVYAKERTGTREQRRNAWSQIIRTEEEAMRDCVREERLHWEQETREIEQDIEELDWTSLWRYTGSRAAPSTTLPPSFTSNDGRKTHIRERDDVLRHVREQAQAIATPTEEDYLGPPDVHLMRLIDEKRRRYSDKAAQMQDWEPGWEDVATVMAHLKKAYNNRKSEGPDQFGADMILFADQAILDCLLLLLQMMADAGCTPNEWRQMRVVLAHKPGRDPQNISKSYRPICVGSLLMKAMEKVFQGWIQSAKKRHPLHPAIMAYTKGIGHDMAIFTATEAALHAIFRSKEGGGDNPRL